MANASLLDVANIETCYGLSQVLFGMSLAIAPGEVVTLMGRNGMGKTTTVRSIMGLTPAMTGSRVRCSLTTCWASTAGGPANDPSSSATIPKATTTRRP